MFPFCCVVGAVSLEAVATLAAGATGLAAGEALHVGVIGCPAQDANAPVAQIVEDHNKLVKRTYPVQRILITAGTAAAVTAALGEKNSPAAIPLCVAAAINVVNVAFAVGVIGPVNKKLRAAAAKKEEEEEARSLLKKWVCLHTVRTGLSVLAFGSTLCGVLLLSKKAKA